MKNKRQNTLYFHRHTNKIRKNRFKLLLPCALLFLLIYSSIFIVVIDGCYVAVGGIDPCDGLVCRPGARCRVSPDGRHAECHCPSACPDYGDHSGSRPVCGEDGRDYRDMCSLDKASCATENGINIKYQGPCGQLYVT